MNKEQEEYANQVFYTSEFFKDIYPPDYFTNQIVEEIVEGVKGNSIYAFVQKSHVNHPDAKMRARVRIGETKTGLRLNTHRSTIGKDEFLPILSEVKVLNGVRDVDVIKMLIHTEKCELSYPNSKSFIDLPGDEEYKKNAILNAIERLENRRIKERKFRSEVLGIF